MQTKILLNSGFSIPSVGLGTWKSKPGKVKEAVKIAINSGYRHIDCAHVYGNEIEIGEALEEIFLDVENGISREDIFITSKLWNTKHSIGDVEGALRTTLQNLRLDYLDLYLIHWPVPFQSGDNNFPRDLDGNVIHTDVQYTETWVGMETLVRKGLIRSIGLSNFNIKQIEEICNIATIPVSILQIENHPYLTQELLVEYAKTKNIVVTAYSPLGSPDRPWGKPNEPSLLDNDLIIHLAIKYNKTPAHILIKFQTQRGIVVIPKSVTPSRIKSNLNVFDFTLLNVDMESIMNLNCNWRACIPQSINKSHPFYPF